MNCSSDSIPVSLTHVLYNGSSEYSKLLAYASLIPIALLVSYCTLCVFSRDVATIIMFVGQLLNETINWILKHLIKEPRPSKKIVPFI